MYGGVIALIWKALSNPQVGGLEKVWKIGVDSGRMTDIFRFDPTVLQVSLIYTHRIYTIKSSIKC